MSIGTDSGAGDGKAGWGGGVGVMEVRSIVGISGAGEGADDQQMGIVGVESVSISISEGASGGGVVRSRTLVTFFFPLFFFGFLMLRGGWFGRFRSTDGKSERV
jgi:hypothetical protein